MKVVLIAPLRPEQIAQLRAVEGRLDVVDAWDAFGPEMVTDWPAQTVEWYLPTHFRTMGDTPELHRQRNALLAEANVIAITFPFPTKIVSRAPNLQLVHQIPAGVSNLVRGDLWRTDVPVTTGRGAGSTLPIAEWAI